MQLQRGSGLEFKKSSFIMEIQHFLYLINIIETKKGYCVMGHKLKANLYDELKELQQLIKMYTLVLHNIYNN